MIKRYPVRFVKCHKCGKDRIESPYAHISTGDAFCMGCYTNESLSIRDFSSREDFYNSYKHGDVKELMEA